MRIKLAKIVSEEQYLQYVQRRASLANRHKYEIRAHSKEINELNLRIIEWINRHDKVNPVQVDELHKSH